MLNPVLLLVVDATFRSTTPVVVVLRVETASIVRSLAAPKTSERSLTSETAPDAISMPLIVSSVGPVIERVEVKAPVASKYDRITCPESAISRM